MAHLSVDGVKVFSTSVINVWRPIIERSDLGQAVKILEELAGVTQMIDELTWRLARRVRNIRTHREWCCRHPQSPRN
jgi:hypothetical protein